VTLAHDIPLNELTALMARSMVVVVTLQEREIAIGQSVLLEAMAMGKPVVATRVKGTVDYVRHMESGILVPPRDPVALRDAIQMLMADANLRRRLGESARAQIVREHLPNHYARGISRVLRRAR
jgi:glycosyltransferase involved in cell wall biosynthesis